MQQLKKAHVLVYTYRPNICHHYEDIQQYNGHVCKLLLAFSIQLQVENNYFVHFFSASDLSAAVGKQIVFVIDVSASMFGDKLQQTKDALKTMLSNLNPNDYFNIVTFSDGVEYWRSNGRLAPASARYIREATAYIDSLQDISGERFLKSQERISRGRGWTFIRRNIEK